MTLKYYDYEVKDFLGNRIIVNASSMNEALDKGSSLLKTSQIRATPCRIITQGEAKLMLNEELNFDLNSSVVYDLIDELEDLAQN